MLLVTGATGNVGSELVRALAAAGQPVRALVRDQAATPVPGAEVAAGDLNDMEAEDVVRSCGLSWTLLRPSGYMSNALQWVPQLRAGDLRFEAKTDEQARADMSAVMPQEYVDAFFRYFADGTYDDSVVYPAVRQLTGRPPRTFRQWARAHAGAFPARCTSSR